MKYIKFMVDAGYCGCQEEYYEEVPDDIIEMEILKKLDNYAREWADECIDDCLTEEDQENEDTVEFYYETAMCLSNYEFISKEEYDEAIK